MTSKRLERQAQGLALGLAALAVGTSSAFAVELAAVPAQWTPPGGGTPIAMWGYVDLEALPVPTTAAAFDCGTVDPAAAWATGPTLSAAAGAIFTINLRNCLDVPVSAFIPGQFKATAPVTFSDGQGRSRVRSFDAETAVGAVGTYTWNSLREGSYLYHSGTHPQVQVQMGLYGALVVTGPAYPPYGAEQLLLFSEIDPALHAAVAGGSYGTAAYPSTFDYYPQYYLVNGAAYPATTSLAVQTGQDTLLRLVNAGLKTHTPTLGGGLYLQLVAEDGNLYPFPVRQYGVELPPAKTKDAVLDIGSDGTYAVYDRSLGLMNAAASGGGMLIRLQATAAASAPTAVADGYSVDEDGVLTADGVAPNPAGVLDNDSPAAVAAVLVSGPASGGLGSGLAGDGSFTYTPNADFNGSDQFTYTANDGAGGPASNLATVTISVTPVNDVPSAVADAYDAVEGTTLSVDAPGVLANDSDIDNDPLTAAASGTPPPELTLNVDGSFTFDATLLVAGSGATFDYVANDGSVDSAPATVTINVVGAAPNTAPVAVDDGVSTPRNTDTPIDVIANDYDPDGDPIDATSVVLPETLTQRGGTVADSGGGIVTYTPPNPGFRGTDTFSYTIEDDPNGTPGDHDGLVSAPATVRVNVTK